MSEPNEAVEETGWDRLTRLYYGDEPSMETDATFRMTRTAFLCGFFFGGFGSANAAKERFEAHSVGKRYASPRDAIRRRWDYATVMFAKSGFRMGLRAAVLAGSVMMLTTHTTVYRNHYSAFYFPAFSGLGAFLIHRACGFFAFPLGIYGQIQALGLGIVSGSMLSATSWLYALSMDKTVDEAYREFKKEYENDLRVRVAEEAELDQIMKQENIKIRAMAYKRLHERQKEKLLATVNEHDDA